MKMFLTRMGEGSKIVVSGDITQVDLPPSTRSGLVDAVHRLRRLRGVSIVELDESDIVRHRLVQEIVQAYEEAPPHRPRTRAVDVRWGVTRSCRITRRSRGPIMWRRSSCRRTFDGGLGSLYRTDVLLRLGICLIAVLCMWVITGGWAPPFSYRLGRVPSRDVCASVAFSVPNPEGTEKERKQQRREIRCTYVNDPGRLKELRSALEGVVLQVHEAESVESLNPKVWNEFLPKGDGAAPAGPTSVQSTVAFTGPGARRYRTIPA